MKKSDNKKSKDKKSNTDLSQFTTDDIAKRFLETPPEPKKKDNKNKE